MLFVASRSCVASSAEDGIVVIDVAIYSTASAFVDFGGALDADVFSDVVGFGFDTTAGLLCLYGGELALASCAVRGARTLRLESIHSYTLSLSLFRSLTLQITALLPSLDDDVDVASSQDRISRYKTKASGSLGEKPSLGLGLLGVRQGEKGVCKCVMVVRLVLIASRGGNVLMERWAHRDSATALIPRDSPLHQHQRRGGGGNIDDDETVTLQRGEALSWLHGAAAELLTGTETKDEEQIVMRRNGVPIVFVPIGDVIFYYVGSDDVDEMQCTFGS